MKLHQDQQLFRQAVQYTSDQLKILPIYVEKDYWVTFALHTILKNEIGKDTVFKGGTALSKCYNLIERFSEDIDLVVLRHEGESNNKLTTKIRKISAILDEVLPERKIDGLTRKMGMNRKTAHSYSKQFQGEYGQVRDAIILEATWLGYSEPYTTRPVNSFIGAMMLNNGQTDMAKEKGLLPFDVLVLEPIRTLCEKIMSLVRFSYGKDPLEDLQKKIRHTYDLHQLLKQEEYFTFFKSLDFDEMLLKVANDDVVSFKTNNSWLENHPSKAIIFGNLEIMWNDLRPTYNGAFKNLVYGVLPNDTDVLFTLKTVKERLATIDWTVRVT